MAETIRNGQTCLEKRGIVERHEEIVRNDYTIDDQYGPTHKNAISDGDVKGKGKGDGGHTHWLPDCTKDKSIIDYKNFSTDPTDQIGGLYDIKGRNGIGGRDYAMAVSLYNYEDQYGAKLVDTTLNQNEGQYVMGAGVK